MDNEYFQDWLAGIDTLSDAQRAEAEAVLLGRYEAVSSLAAVELGVGDDRCCPHCSTPGAVSRGKARGLRRYQCKSCRRTFNAATGNYLKWFHLIKLAPQPSSRACLATAIENRAYGL